MPSVLNKNPNREEDNDIWLLHVATYLSLVVQAKTGQSVTPSPVWKNLVCDSKSRKLCLLQATGLCRLRLP